VSVPVLVLTRVALGAALLIPFALRRKEFGALKPVWPWLLLFAVVEIIMPWFALSEAERGISSSLTGLLIASTPIIVAVISLFLRGGDRLSPVRWIGLLIGLGGVAMLAGPHLVGSSSGSARSVAEVLFVAVCYATGPLIANRKLADVPPIAMTAACLVLASVVYAPVAALNWPTAVPSASVLLSMAGLAIVCTAAAFLIFFKLISEAGPARASVITYINPAIAVTLGVVVLSEHVTVTMLIAFATILVGSVLATRPTRRAVSRSGADEAVETVTGAPREHERIRAVGADASS
ncbi:MAG: DMT family transporter, partial [Streptosporangiaceae bacterium]